MSLRYGLLACCSSCLTLTGFVLCKGKKGLVRHEKEVLKILCNITSNYRQH